MKVIAIVFLLLSISCRDTTPAEPIVGFAETFEPCDIENEGEKYMKTILRDTSIKKMLVSSVAANRKIVYFESSLPIPEIDFRDKDFVKDLPLSKYKVDPNNFNLQLSSAIPKGKSLLLTLEKLNCNMGIFRFTVPAYKGTEYSGIFYKAHGTWTYEVLINVEV